MARVGLRRIVETKAVVAAAPRVSQTFDQYRTKQQLIAARVVTLAIAAALAADALFDGIGQRLGTRA